MIIDKELFFSLLNKQHPEAPKRFNDSNIVINDPEPFNDNGRGEINTRILLEAIEGSGYSGKAYVYCNSHRGQNVINIPLETDISWRYVLEQVNEIQESHFKRSDLPDYDLTLDILPITFTIEYKNSFLFGDPEFIVNVYLKDGLSKLLEQKSIYPSIVTGVDVYPNLSSINNNMYLYDILNVSTPIGNFVNRNVLPQLVIPEYRSILLEPLLNVDNIFPSLNFQIPKSTTLSDQITNIVLTPDIGISAAIDEYVKSDLLPELELSPIISVSVMTDMLPALMPPIIKEDSISIIDKNLLPALTFNDRLNNESDGTDLASKVLEDQLLLEQPLSDLINRNLLNSLAFSIPYMITNINSDLLPQIEHKDFANTTIRKIINKDLLPSLISPDNLSTDIETDLLPGLTKPVLDPNIDIIDDDMLPALIKPVPPPTIREFNLDVLPELVISKSLTEVMNENQYIKTIKD